MPRSGGFLERERAGMIVDKALAMIKKDVLSAMRYRNGFVFEVLSPVTQLAALYYLAKAVGNEFRPEGMPYFLFLVIGNGFYTFLLAGANSFLRAIQESQHNGMLEVLMTTSTRSATLVSLSAMSAFGGGAFQFLIYMVAGLLGISGGRVNLGAFLAVFLLSALIAFATGLFAAGLQIAIHKGSALLWLFGSSAWLLTGTMFPVEVLPAPVRAISGLLPFTHALTGMRMAIVQNAGTGPLTRELGILFLFTITLVPLSLAFFSWTVRRARQLGTLSFY